MSKKRKNQQPQRPAAKPVLPSPAKTSVAQTPSAAKSPSTPPGGGRANYAWLLALVPVVLIGGVVVWLLSRPATPAPVTTASATSSSGVVAGPTPTAQKFIGQVGGVTGCRKQAAFSQQLGFSRGTLLSTAERTIKGLVIVEPSQDNTTPPRTYQHPSWTMGGYLGPNAIDEAGNIYVAPAPRVNLIDNPPERANIIYKVDTNTGVMTDFLNLPFVQAPSLQNPYGILGMTYDCDTHSMYVASVAGSSRENELGRIFHIDLNTGKVESQMDAIDAIGIGVFNSAQDKRLYFGTARMQEVRSVELDAHGKFIGQPREEFSLADLGPDGNDKARKISFDRTNDMIVNGTKFTFNLAPPVAQVSPSVYRFRYDAALDKWTFAEVTAGQGALVQ